MRSHNEVLGYNIQAKDGDLIGHVDNFIMECNTWEIKISTGGYTQLVKGWK